MKCAIAALFLLFSRPASSFASMDQSVLSGSMKPIMSSKQEQPPVPLIAVASNTDVMPPSDYIDTSRSLVQALQNSGFLLVKSPLLTSELQCNALEAASSFLQANDNDNDSKHVISHPTDPKIYAMLDSNDIHNIQQDKHKQLRQYMDTLQLIKMDILRHIAVGLGMKDCDFFAKLHNENNDTLRLISYHPSPTNSLALETGNRCKEHSDYGTITLLSTDGVSGLELFHQGKWMPVPHVKGALVVNIGSLLSGWTKGALRATLHRVAGPASLNSTSPREDLLEAVKRTRTSIAFFADPNEDVSASLTKSGDEEEQEQGLAEMMHGMSVSEYTEWRSGGSGIDRSGISFTSNESDEMKGQLREREDD